MFAWFRTHVRKLLRAPDRYHLERVAELPDVLAPDAVYVVGEGKHEWFVGLRCPCGCQATIQLNLQADSRPRWQYQHHWNDTVTLDPSINRIRGCRSHFWLKRGKLLWCRN